MSCNKITSSLYALLILCISLEMSESHDRPYLRSALARNLYSKMLMDERLRNMDLKELYELRNPGLLSPLAGSLFVQLGPDEESRDFLTHCQEENDRLFLQLFQEVARSFLGIFLKQTSINGLLNRGRMFVWSKDQAKTMLMDRDRRAEGDHEQFYDAEEVFRSHGSFKYTSSAGETRETDHLHPDSLKLAENECSAQQTTHQYSRKLGAGLPSARAAAAASSDQDLVVHPSPEPITHGLTLNSDQQGANLPESPCGIEFPDEWRGRPAQAFDVRLNAPSLRPADQGQQSSFDCSPSTRDQSLSEKSHHESSFSGQHPDAGDARGPHHSFHMTEDHKDTPGCKFIDPQRESNCGGDSELGRYSALSRPEEEIDVHGDEIGVPEEDSGAQNDDVPWRNRVILDVGAGDGHVTRMIADEARSVTATEISYVMRARLRQKGYRVLDAHHWPENDDVTYDLVTCLNVLDRHYAPRRLLQAMRDKLVPGGKLVVALVLPFKPYVEYESPSHLPQEVLGLTGDTLEQQLDALVTKVLPDLGFKVESWTKLPYFCEGDLDQSYYWLEDVVLVARKIVL